MIPRPRAQTSGRSARTRAFTLLELMLALALASLVIASAMGVLWMVVDTDRRLDQRFDEQVELTTAQIIIRRSMASLVASPPVKPEAGRPKASGAPADTAPGDRTGEEKSGQEMESQAKEADPLKLHAEESGASPELIAELFETRFQGRPNFELYFDTDSGPEPLPRLEIVVMDSPVPPALPVDENGPTEREIAGFLPIRGAFAIYPQLDPPGYALVWEPLLPAGPATVLIHDLDYVEWWALPTKDEGAEWVQVQASVIQETYPVAVRLALWTRRGTHVDWLFETGISTPGPLSPGGAP